MRSPPLQIADLMRGFEPFWAVAGGWAIDLFLGETTRTHADIEIAICRCDQAALQTYLREWILKKAENGRLKIWETGELLKPPIHAIHCFNKNFEPSFLEVLLNEFDRNRWLFRRDIRITKSFSESYLTAPSGIRFLRPEIVLLYKSKNPRPKDEIDFENAAAKLGESAIIWLKNALKICDAENRWLLELEKL